MAPGVKESIARLMNLGYELWVEDGKIKFRYQGNGRPTKEEVGSLLESLKAHRQEALVMLRGCAEPEQAMVGEEPDLCPDPVKDGSFDLRVLAGARFKITLEESWVHERLEVRGPDRRWFLQIPCKGGGFTGLYAEEPTIIF